MGQEIEGGCHASFFSRCVSSLGDRRQDVLFLLPLPLGAPGVGISAWTLGPRRGFPGWVLLHAGGEPGGEPGGERGGCKDSPGAFVPPFLSVRGAEDGK